MPLAVRWRPGRKTVVVPEGAAAAASAPTRADPALVKALARAFRCQRLLDEGRYALISETAEGERIERGHLGTLLRLTLLAPGIVEAIIDGRPPEGLNLPRFLVPFPVEWSAQHKVVEPS